MRPSLAIPLLRALRLRQQLKAGVRAKRSLALLAGGSPAEEGLTKPLLPCCMVEEARDVKPNENS